MPADHPEAPPVPPDGRAGVVVAVVGGGEPDPVTDAVAREVGRLVARAGAVLVCGGLGGVMAAACRGAAEAGGLTVGILPGPDRSGANPWVRVAVATGLGELRNGVVVGSADVVVAIGGEYGTLSEIALALRAGRPVVGLGTWNLVRPDGEPERAVATAGDPASAVSRALALAAESHAVPGARRR